jgi:hypothetical protein
MAMKGIFPWLGSMLIPDLELEPALLFLELWLLLFLL